MSIKRIAQMAGVSIATVSRVLNNPDYRCSSEEVRERIFEAAREINYTPNLQARNLKMGVKSNKDAVRRINILVTRMEHDRTDPFFVELLHVIQNDIREKECILGRVWYEPLFSDDKKVSEINIEKKIMELLSVDEKIESDGLVIIGKCNEKVLTVLKNKCKNIVSINRNSTNYVVDEVVCDGAKIAGLAIDYLVSRGHKNIGYVGNCYNEMRYHGYMDALKRHGLELQVGYIVEAEQTEVSGYLTMERLSGKSDVPTAFYCANDSLALGMLKYLSEKKWKGYCPAIISSDGIEKAEEFSPRLSTVRVPKKDMGRLAIAILLDRMENRHESVVKLELNGELFRGETC